MRDRRDDDEPGKLDTELEFEREREREEDPRLEGSGDPSSELDRLARERAEYLESWKRARADYQNLRRRLASDVDSAVAKARQSLLSELLLVLDFLDMALRTPTTTDEGKNLKVGVEMTRAQMMQILEREGVVPIADAGRFDPAIHQAVETVVTDALPPGEVVETVRRGYRMGEHVLRHAHVKVAEPPNDERPGA